MLPRLIVGGCDAERHVESPHSKTRGAPSVPLFASSTRCRAMRTKRGTMYDAPTTHKRPNRRHDFEADRELRLARVAVANPEEAVEVEKLRRGQRVDIVGVVESVEHFELGDEGIPFAETERPCDAEVEGEEGVILAQRIASGIHAVL